MPVDPYAALGLRRNPFVAEPRPGVPESLWLVRGEGDAPAPSGRRLVQVIGVKGAGKTSLLLRWRERRPGPYRHVPPGANRLCLPPLAPICYWDEADRLPAPLLRLALWRAARAGATVVAGAHGDLSGVAARAGLAVETVPIEPFDGATLCRWAALRIAAVRLEGAACSLTLDQATACSIAAEAAGCWRTAGDRLHSWAAKHARRRALR